MLQELINKFEEITKSLAEFGKTVDEMNDTLGDIHSMLLQESLKLDKILNKITKE